MNVQATNRTNIKPVLKKLKGDELGLFASNEWRRLIDDYVPADTLTLARNVRLTAWEIEYFSPYSVYVYNGGRNKRAVFRKDRHYKATKEWDKAAIRDRVNEKLNKSIQGWVDKNI